MANNIAKGSRQWLNTWQPAVQRSDLGSKRKTITYKTAYVHYFVLLLICALPFVSVGVYAHENESDRINVPTLFDQTDEPVNHGTDSVWKPCFSPFIELGGKGFFSMNIDYRFKEAHAASFGFLFEGLAPNVMYYYLAGKRHRLEIGGGLTGGFTNKMDLAVILIHGTIGYRYQKKNGIFFRAGFTPFFSSFPDDRERNMLYPFAGLSLGYSF